jgi:hypothetical protein
MAGCAECAGYALRCVSICAQDATQQQVSATVRSCCLCADAVTTTHWGRMA